MAFSSSVTAAISRLLSSYNGNAYNAITNPFGLAKGGHRINEIAMMQDVAAVGSAISATTEELADAIASLDSSGTSSSSVAIGTGTKNFTTQTGLGFLPGQLVKAADTGAPATNYLVGVVTSYNSGTGALVLDAIATAGSGTLTSWAIMNSRYPFQEFTVSGRLEGFLSNGTYEIGFSVEALELLTLSFASGSGTATVTTYLSPTDDTGDGTAITGGAFSVSTTPDINALTAENETIAGSKNFLLAEVSSASGLVNLYYELTYRKQVDV